MWANAQRDGRLAEYRWRPLFNDAKFGWRRLPCSNAAKTRNPLKFAWVPQTRQRISAASGPKFTILWEHLGEILLFKNFVDTYLNYEDVARQNCAMVPRWWIFGNFCVLHFQQATCSTFQTCILNSHYGHTMSRSMVDIQSATAEIRRGKKEKERNRRTKISWPPYYIGWP